MNYYTLCDLKIKLLDFISLLSPLGNVKKIVSNGVRHLVEINFHNSILQSNKDENINTNSISTINQNILDNTLIKVYNDNNLGYIINDNTAILELPKGIEDNDEYLKNLKEKTKESISKYIKKNLPKDCQKILKKKINLEGKNLTNPENINILNFPGYRIVSV